MADDLAYDITEQHLGVSWRVTGAYDGPQNIHVYRDGDLVLTETCEGYRIWNYAAHLSDIARMVEDAREEAHRG